VITLMIACSCVHSRCSTTIQDWEVGYLERHTRDPASEHSFHLRAVALKSIKPRNRKEDDVLVGLLYSGRVLGPWPIPVAYKWRIHAPPKPSL
jgi:hypothetical protein